VFPTLTLMSYNIFVILVSTVSFDSYFNTANKVLTDKKMRLGENMFEALILLKDWHNIENRLQDKSWIYSIDRE
jgi:hAT family C-terminal dimerisation region